MVKVVFEDDFKRRFSKIKDFHIKSKIIKQVQKLKENPLLGKPMRYSRKGTRELYISPFRLSYQYEKISDMISICALYHKDEQ